MKTTLTAVAAGLAALAAAGCQNMNAPMSASMGQATADSAAQIVDPNPAQGAPESDGERGVGAVDRYQAGEIKQPERVTTSDMSKDS
jgi:hypothetical protein